MRRPSRWTPRSRLLLGFALTGLIVTALSTWVASLPLSESVVVMPDASWLLIPAFFFILAAVISGWISWRSQRDERLSGRRPSLRDAASGPLAVTLLFGLPIVVISFTWRGLIIVSAGLVLSSAGYYLSARWRGDDADSDDPPVSAQALADDDDPPLVSWRVTLRRGLFLLLATFVVSLTVVLIYVPLKILPPLGEGLSGIRAQVFAYYLAGLPVVWLILALLQDDVHSSWRRFAGRVGAVNLVVLPLGLFGVAFFGFWNWVAGLLVLATLILGGIIAHPLALLWEQATAKDDRVARAEAAVAARAQRDTPRQEAGAA